jgi:hypothetical protein
VTVVLDEVLLDVVGATVVVVVGAVVGVVDAGVPLTVKLALPF